MPLFLSMDELLQLFPHTTDFSYFYHLFLFCVQHHFCCSMMDFHSEFSQHIHPVIYNDGLFSDEEFIGVDTSTLLPVLSPTIVESVFDSDKDQTPINKQKNGNESISLKKERMLENGQIKIFTQAIDSYYNSTSDSVSPSLSSTTSPSTGYINSNAVNDIEMSPTSEYFKSSRITNQVARISENSVSADNCQVKKTWNSNVGKKILAVHFSPMNIKSEFLSTQTMLDGFEAFALQEAANAIQGIIIHEHSEEILKAHQADLCADPRPVDLVRACEKSRAFRKLHLEDKIELLKNAFLDLNVMKNVITFNPKLDGWLFCGNIYTRQRLFLKNPDLRKKAFNIMDTFPVRFKTDINVCALLFLIIIFNADLPDLMYRNTIKSEQYVYIYLLRRYLVSCIEPTCEALDYFYQLMDMIEEIQELKVATETDFDSARANGSYLLQNRVVRYIELGSVQQ
ncbi:uncharacterized protein LOC107362606 [Tetranychus urticae]|uniref:uncharacterized protein LOC107362606 n=1 Tax=Tetranychus urticae TaxID=32264 RepID=UPI000D643C7A|nr:uncharacterized protein LOC107362606 [Tetranychus urticae]